MPFDYRAGDADCNDFLKITDIQAFSSGCTLVRWEDTSTCGSSGGSVSQPVYNLELLQNCSDTDSVIEPGPLIQLDYERKVVTFNNSLYKPPLYLRVKANRPHVGSDESFGHMQWKSTCNKLHPQTLHFNSSTFTITLANKIANFEIPLSII